MNVTFGKKSVNRGIAYTLIGLFLLVAYAYFIVFPELAQVGRVCTVCAGILFAYTIYRDATGWTDEVEEQVDTA